MMMSSYSTDVAICLQGGTVAVRGLKGRSDDMIADDPMIT